MGGQDIADLFGRLVEGIGLVRLQIQSTHRVFGGEQPKRQNRHDGRGGQRVTPVVRPAFVFLEIVDPDGVLVPGCDETGVFLVALDVRAASVLSQLSSPGQMSFTPKISPETLLVGPLCEGKRDFWLRVADTGRHDRLNHDAVW
ncbi:hypothetical protein [Mycobacterium sp. Z3061]|uniref:hypothetical protein n=1 Tax=Mycobacterium sp. Z3061 TaxID=3073562 RepID=UPI002872BD08|nr:hypothetical protein [Mycobacterium sp. Z3061]